MSRLGTIGVLFGTLSCCLGLTQTGPCPFDGLRPVPCMTDADCAPMDPCWTGTCGTDGSCDFADVECPEGQECDGGTCKTPCDADSDCDDADGCTVDACGDDGFCTTTGATDCDDDDACTDDSCATPTGCVHTEIDCDDGAACTDDGCDDGTCTHDDNCAAGSACNEDTGECVVACDDAGDCDDGDPCTDDACVNNGCSNTADNCDDGVACTDDGCDGGTCRHADNCTPPRTCDSATGLCEDVPPCTADADCDDADPCTNDVCIGGQCTHANNSNSCDDGLYCNGADICSAGSCSVHIGNPCTGSGDCNEATDSCDLPTGLPMGACCLNGNTCNTSVTQAACAGVWQGPGTTSCTNCMPVMLDFTLAQDNAMGTTGNDTFSAPLLIDSGSGTPIASLQTSDSGNGLAGTDTLNASFNVAANVVPSSLSDIEIINITNSAAGTVTLFAGNISGVDSFNSVSSVDDITIASIQELADFGMSTINSAAVDLSMQFGLASTTSGTTDTLTGTLSGANAGTVTIQTAAGTTNGFETLALVSNGSSANTLTAISQTNGATMATLNISGAQALTLNTIPNTILTVDGATMTGALQLGTGTSTANYATFATANLNNVTGGTGNDTFIFAGTFDANDFDAPGEALNGGAGTDIFQASFAATIGTALQLSGIEELRWNATANSVSVNLTGVTGLTTATIECDGTANTGFTLLNISGSPLPTLAFRGNNTQAAQTCDGVTYQATGVAGSSDSLALTIGNRGTALNASGTTNVTTVGALTIPSMESLSLTVTDGPATFGGITASTLTSFTATASSNLTLGTVNDGTAGGTSSIVSVNLSAVTGNSSATFNDLGTGASVTLGAGNDTFISTGSAGTSSTISGGAGNDTITAHDGSANVINGEAGNDTLVGGSGNDTINGGADDDTINGEAGADTLSGGTGNDTIDGGANDDTINGEDGNDIIVGGSGNDTINGGLGNDTITPGTGDDAGTPGAGNDTIIFAASSLDTLTLETGDLDGSAIDDIFDFTASAAFIGGTTVDIAIVSDADLSAGGANNAAAGDNIIILTGQFFADAAALNAATTADGLVNMDNGKALFVYSTAAGGDTRMAFCNVIQSGDLTACTDLVIITGLTVAEASTGLANTNFVTD